MAAQWRIRHKLLLGLGLMVAFMVIIILGAVRGMWAYYVTNGAIRAKHAELRAAEDFKEAITELISQSSLDSLAHLPFEVHNKELRSRELLDKFDNLVRENIEHGQSPQDCNFEKLMVDPLRKGLDTFEQAVINTRPVMSQSGFSSPRRTSDDLLPAAEDAAANALAPTDPGQGAAKPANGARPGTGEEAAPADPVPSAARALKLATSDLRDRINQDLVDRLNETRSHYQIAFWTIVPAGTLSLIVLLGGIPFFGWVVHPLRELEAGVARVASGDFSQRIEVDSGDEMQELADAFNDMTARLQELYADLARQVNERSRQLVRSERLASVGFLAAGVAHEINNPLASIAFCSEALEARLADLLRIARAMGRGEDGEVFAKYLKMIQDEAFRCKNITERLLEFSRTGERRREETDLAALVQSVLDLTQHLQNSRGKELELRVNTERVPGGRILARVNAEEIKSVVLNLVVNALDSMDGGGKLTIALGQRDGMAELKFTDTGCGMTQEVLDNIFEPFFTRSRSGKGTGLGLTISHRIVTQHGGELEAASAGPSQGSTFTVRLPLQPAETPSLPASEATPARPRPALRNRQAA